MRRFVLVLLRRQLASAAFADVVKGELVGGNGLQLPEPDEKAADRYKCGCCLIMPTEEENKCCTPARCPCISGTKRDRNILEISLRYRDVLVSNNVRNNEKFRHAA